MCARGPRRKWYGVSVVAESSLDLFVHSFPTPPADTSSSPKLPSPAPGIGLGLGTEGSHSH